VVPISIPYKIEKTQKQTDFDMFVTNATARMSVWETTNALKVGGASHALSACQVITEVMMGPVTPPDQHALFTFY